MSCIVAVIHLATFALLGVGLIRFFHAMDPGMNTLARALRRAKLRKAQLDLQIAEDDVHRRGLALGKESATGRRYGRVGRAWCETPPPRMAVHPRLRRAALLHVDS